ncbi:MAG TPA: SemiSWEET transporter [Ferruginibacter sp.]|nr:SemiSWEET transporter [Ferruginibacter sp.]
MNWFNITGLVAAFFTTTSFLPQAVKTIRSKDTSAISMYMYIMFTFGTLMWLIYGIEIHNIPVSVANGITLILATVILFFKVNQTFNKKKME